MRPDRILRPSLRQGEAGPGAQVHRTMPSRPRPCQSPQLLARRWTSCIPTDAIPHVHPGIVLSPPTTADGTTKLLIQQRQPPQR